MKQEERNKLLKILDVIVNKQEKQVLNYIMTNSKNQLSAYIAQGAKSTIVYDNIYSLYEKVLKSYIIVNPIFKEVTSVLEPAILFSTKVHHKTLSSAFDTYIKLVDKGEITLALYIVLNIILSNRFAYEITSDQLEFLLNTGEKNLSTLKVVLRIQYLIHKIAISNGIFYKPTNRDEQILQEAQSIFYNKHAGVIIRSKIGLKLAILYTYQLFYFDRTISMITDLYTTFKNISTQSYRNHYLRLFWSNVIGLLSISLGHREGLRLSMVKSKQMIPRKKSFIYVEHIIRTKFISAMHSIVNEDYSKALYVLKKLISLVGKFKIFHLRGFVIFAHILRAYIFTVKQQYSKAGRELNKAKIIKNEYNYNDMYPFEISIYMIDFFIELAISNSPKIHTNSRLQKAYGRIFKYLQDNGLSSVAKVIELMLKHYPSMRGVIFESIITNLKKELKQHPGFILCLQLCNPLKIIVSLYDISHNYSMSESGSRQMYSSFIIDNEVLLAFNDFLEHCNNA